MLKAMRSSPTFRFSRTLLLALVSAPFLLAGCSDNAAHNAEIADTPAAVQEQVNNQITAEHLAELAGDIFRLVGTPTADHPRYCKALPFGAKACGGPASYLVYSTQVTDSATLEAMVERYNTLSARYNEQEGLMSDCAVVDPVVPNVVNGMCVASPLVSM